MGEMRMTVLHDAAAQGTWREGESEQVLRELVRYLEPKPLLRRFAELVAQVVPFELLEFRHPGPGIACAVYQGENIQAGAAVSRHPIASGTLRFVRSEPYGESDRRQLAAFTELLQLPLHNAIRYFRACSRGEHPLTLGEHDLDDMLSLESFINGGALSEALQDEQLTLHYQPKVDMKSGMVVGLEALIRWQHATLGLLSPELFIPIAERSGVIRPLSRWVLQEVVRQSAIWREEGLLTPIAVNLSGMDLEDRELPAYLDGLLSRWEVPANLLELEITETAAIANHEVGVEILRRLSALGVSVAIDDFGIGYSSLQRLRLLPVNTIKIDKSFVIDADGGGEGMVFVDTITRLGHRLGLKVVAEGVECRESWDRLVRAGCDVGQGYHISRPLPGEAMTCWLRNGAQYGMAGNC